MDLLGTCRLLTVRYCLVFVEEWGGGLRERRVVCH